MALYFRGTPEYSQSGPAWPHLLRLLDLSVSAEKQNYSGRLVVVSLFISPLLSW